jgi:glutamate carboxypeptidase
MSEILNYLIEHQSEMEETLLKLVKAESPSTNKKLVDACGDVLQAEYEGLIGGQCERIEKEAVGDQFRFTIGSGDEQLLIIGHYDTVWDEGQLPIEQKDGKLYGPGTFDMKGGLTVSLWAMKALRELGYELNRKVVFLVSSDEEIGSEHSRELIEEEAKKSIYVFVPESSIPPNGDIKTARKGVGMYKMRIKGIPVHAGNAPDKGVNAIEELALQITDLSRLTNHQEGTTVTVGVVSGGTRSNVKAEYAEAEIDVRFITKEQGVRLDDQVRNRKPFLPEAIVEVDGGINRFPLERTEESARLFEEIREITLRHGYDLKEGLSGGGSDGNLTFAVGTPTIDGLGPVGDGPHARNEHVFLENLPYRAALMAELLLKHVKKD